MTKFVWNDSHPKRNSGKIIWWNGIVDRDMNFDRLCFAISTIFGARHCVDAGRGTLHLIFWTFVDRGE